MIIYFYLISFSLIGYGLLISQFLRINVSDFGNLGILGITFLSIISYSTSLFLNHGILLNSFILFLGIFLFFLFIKKINNLKKEIILLFLIFSLLIIFILIAKNHDDFSYYHFPYSIFLTEFSHPIGFGNLNNGFRSPSSIFFINSMFYLPGVNYFLFHFAAAYLFGFANLILLKFTFDKEIFTSKKFINFLSLISLIFINIFFYRLAEHGTDRSGMILTIILVIYLLSLTNNIKDNIEKNTEILKIFLVYTFFVITIKPFFLINFIFIFVLFFYNQLRKIFLQLFFTPTFYYCFLLLFFTIFYTFLNSSCFIFPITFTCLESLSWSLDIDNIKDVNVWFELWSKAGATPNFVVENRIEYIQGLNWLSNWIENYFFNKVSDFILGILFLVVVIYLSFFGKKVISTSVKTNFLLVYLCLLFLFFEWFFFHPALRYGGYHVIALLFFIPVCLELSKKKLDFEKYSKGAFVLLLITSIVFISRNALRLEKEIVKYNYNPLKNIKYKFIGGNKEYYFRHNIQMRENINAIDSKNFLGKKIYITKFN